MSDDYRRYYWHDLNVLVSKVEADMDFHLEQHLNGRQNISITVSAILLSGRTGGSFRNDDALQTVHRRDLCRFGSMARHYILRNPTFHNSTIPAFTSRGFPNILQTASSLDFENKLRSPHQECARAGPSNLPPSSSSTSRTGT